VNLLLDTHCFLWWIDNDPKLNAAARSQIQDPENLVFVSTVTAWEISIKSSLGKLRAPNDYETELEVHRLQALPILNSHALAVKNLPFHHQDPFDRLLVAQAQLERLTLVTHDERIKLYGVSILMT
jgi:PIN domain nuclease of toxin-antitoxin system